MIIGINLIAESDETGSGVTTYIKNMFQEIGKNYVLNDCKFIVYKQRCISEKYWGIPVSLDVEYVNVPNIGNGFKRVIFEQTIFYSYIKTCDVFYSYCESMPLFIKAKRVYTQHDIYFLEDKNSYSTLKRLYRKYITYLYIKRCEKILTVSDYSKKSIMYYYHVPDEKISITYNFIQNTSSGDLKKYNVIKDYFGNEITVPETFLLYIGRLQHSKNIIRMLDGFEKFKLHSFDNNCKLIIVGKSAYDADKTIEKLKKTKDVIYLGFAERELVNYLLSKCLAIVLLSLFEGFGIPLIEGFAYGKPCLTSKTASLPEVAGNAGIHVNPYDIDEIAYGYSLLLTHYSELTSHITKQLEKFAPSLSAETFMDTLGINYKKTKK